MDSSQNKDTNPSPDSILTTVDNMSSSKIRWHKQKLVWVLVILVLVAAVAGGCYLYNVTPNKLQSVAQHSVESKLLAYALIYVTSAEKEDPVCPQRTDTVHHLNLDNQDSTDALTVVDHQKAVEFATFRDNVMLATVPSCASKIGPSLWLSKDSGMTYKKIYTSKIGTVGAPGSITSVAFSTDGAEVVFGLLHAPDQKSFMGENTVKTINIKTGKVTDLFTSKWDDVSVTSYDKAKQRIYYQENCFTCERATPPYLLMYDLKSNKSTVVNEQITGAGYTSAINANASRAVSVERSDSKVSQLSQFTINEVDLTTKKIVNFAAYTGATSTKITPRSGYTTDGSVYYIADKKVIILGEGGKSSELARVPSAIYEVYHVSKSQVIYRTGDWFAGEVIDYDIESGKATHVLKYKYPTTTPLGVSYMVNLVK